MQASETIFGNHAYKVHLSFGEKGKKGKKDLKKPHICYIGTITTVHKKAVEGIYSNSLGCSIRVIVQSGFAPSVNSLWNLKKERE